MHGRHSVAGLQPKQLNRPHPTPPHPPSNQQRETVLHCLHNRRKPTTMHMHSFFGHLLGAGVTLTAEKTFLRIVIYIDQ